MKELFLFVRPPRPLWPFNGPSSAFWPPLAFASMAAMLREHVPDLRVEILDAPAQEMGWRTLESELRRRAPAYVGIGEEAVSCVEGLRLARLARAVGARVVAGGCFFGHVAGEVLATGLVDTVVHGEGEQTLVDWVQAVRNGSPDALEKVDGISFLKDSGEVTATRPRELIRDLDTLPFPAYDLLPVECYGRRSRNHPNLAAIELGRGCVGACDFCILWRQMSRHVDGRAVPSLRVKSPERLLEEIRVLVRQYDRRYLGWVDPCFNAHPQVPARLSELLLRENLSIGQSAWMRTDALVRDAASGGLESCVRSGLNEVYLGIERMDAGSLGALHKTCGTHHAAEAMRLLRERFPEILVVGSFIYGMEGDTPEMMRQMYRMSVELDFDECFFIPLTPLPGTSGWRPDLWDPSGERFRDASFLPAGRRGGRNAALERALLFSTLFHWPPVRVKNYLHHFLGNAPRRRRVNWRLLKRNVSFALNRYVRTFFDDSSCGMVFPSWYER
jgi:radical SAM superfamily enzyme YgiQ (UPF0313 family)